jgi:hypothetical protein
MVVVVVAAVVFDSGTVAGVVAAGVVAGADRTAGSGLVELAGLGTRVVTVTGAVLFTSADARGDAASRLVAAGSAGAADVV